MTRHTVKTPRGRATKRRPATRWNGWSNRFGSMRLAAGTLSASILFVSIVWAIASGWLPRTLEDLQQSALAATGSAGFRVEEVLVAGRDQTDREVILAALGVQRGDPILAFDPHGAYARVMELPWIRSASVERRLPGTILVRIDERVPMALWQYEQRHRLIDRQGNVLADSNLQPFAHLPLVVGADAHQHARVFLDRLIQHPVIADRVRAAIRVGERRWDLQLDNGIEVLLPETGVADAFNELGRLVAEAEIFERDVVSIDLRFDDRLIVRTSPVASERRRLPEEPT